MNLRHMETLVSDGLGGRTGGGRRVGMKMRRLAFAAGAMACASMAALVAACATTSPAGEPAPQEGVPVPDGGLDGNMDGEDGDAAACTDCEYFLETCQPDVFCPHGPFEPSTAGGAFDRRTQINAIRGRSASDVWVAGALGGLAHFDGTSWRRSDPGTQDSMRALWLRDSEEVALLRLEFVYTRGASLPDAGVSAGGWTRQEPASLPAEYEAAASIFESGWGATGAEWFWVATRRHSNAIEPTSGLWRLRRLPSGELEAGVGLRTAEFRGQMTAVHGASPDVLWSVGLEGATVRITGAQGDTPTFETFNSQTWDALNGVWAASASEAWAVGARGTIRHYTGDPTFLDVVSDVPTTQTLRAVWGSSPSDIWVVGDGAVILHYDGTSWTRVKIAGLGARRPDLTTVWVAGKGQVWTGGHGVVLSLGGSP